MFLLTNQWKDKSLIQSLKISLIQLNRVRKSEKKWHSSWDRDIFAWTMPRDHWSGKYRLISLKWLCIENTKWEEVQVHTWFTCCVLHGCNVEFPFSVLKVLGFVELLNSEFPPVCFSFSFWFLISIIYITPLCVIGTYLRAIAILPPIISLPLSSIFFLDSFRKDAAHQGGKMLYHFQSMACCLFHLGWWIYVRIKPPI